MEKEPKKIGCGIDVATGRNVRSGTRSRLLPLRKPRTASGHPPRDRQRGARTGPSEPGIPQDRLLHAVLAVRRRQRVRPRSGDGVPRHRVRRLRKPRRPRVGPVLAHIRRGRGGAHGVAQPLLPLAQPHHLPHSHAAGLGDGVRDELAHGGAVGAPSPGTTPARSAASTAARTSRSA